VGAPSQPSPQIIADHVIDAVGDGIVVANDQGELVFFNKAAERLLGIGLTDTTPDEWAEVYGTFLPDGVTKFPAERYSIVRALDGEETDNVELLIRNANVPQGVLISVTGRPMRRPSGEIFGAVVTFRDITDLKRAQEQLAQTVTELRRVEKQKAELSALLVHDLRSPLTAIIGNVAFMLERERSEADHDCLRDVKRAAENIHRMVIDLLDISLSEDGALTPKLELVELRSLFADVHAAMAHSAVSKGQTLEVLGFEGPERIEADRELLRRVMQNLVDNSIKYGASGGRIVLDAFRSGQSVVLRVRDRGPGVPEAYRVRIFDRYARVERSPDRSEPSSRGLGLHFCRVAIEALGGKIWVEDNEPQGACFCVQLPIQR
jgi:signal transduction histidine kinase